MDSNQGLSGDLLRTGIHEQTGDLRSAVSAGSGDPRRAGAGNLHLYDFVPYNQVLHRYDAAIIHGGTGILYTCLEHAVPMLVWPHDYDQFDHAARIVHHRLGLRLQPTAARIARDLQQLMSDAAIRSSLQRFQQCYRQYDAGKAVFEALQAIPATETTARASE